LGNPVGLRDELHDHEIPNEFEVNLIRGSLTDEQWEAYQLSKKLALATKREELLENIRSEVVALAANSTAPIEAVRNTQIASQLREKYGEAAPSKADIERILEEEAE
jgi:hypothetical protein